MSDLVHFLDVKGQDDFPPSYTALHLLDHVVKTMFGTHHPSQIDIGRKKSRVGYVLDHKPTKDEVKDVIQRLEYMIEADIPIEYEDIIITELSSEARQWYATSGGQGSLRAMRIGENLRYLFLGKHVRSTSQIGRIELLDTDWVQRERMFVLRYKVVNG